MRLILFFSLLICCISAFAEVYKWVDKNGRIHYSDSPPPAEQKAQTLDTGELNTVNTEVADIGPKVVIYTTSWCGPCKTAKAWFKKQGIAFTEYDIEKSRRGKREYDKLGEKSVPVILVNGQKMVGFNPQRFKQLYGK